MFVFICTIFLFTPLKYLKYFGLDVWAIHYRPYFAVGFLAFFFLLVASIGQWLSKTVVARRVEKRRIENYLKGLSRDEVLILLRYSESGTKTQYFHPANGAVNNLVQNRILYQSAGMYSKLKGLAYSLRPVVVPYVLNRDRFQKLILAENDVSRRPGNSN
jgi:Super-infection exclusion protein B